MESRLVRSSAGRKSTCAPAPRRIPTNASNSSDARATAGAALKFSGFHCAAIASSLTNASRGCLTSTRVRRPTSENELSRTALQHAHARHHHDDLFTLIQHLEQRSDESAIRL